MNNYLCQKCLEENKKMLAQYGYCRSHIPQYYECVMCYSKKTKSFLNNR